VNKTIWATIAVLTALIPTASLAANSISASVEDNPPTPVLDTAIKVGQSAINTGNVCAENLSVGCINSAAETLGTAGVKFTSGENAAIDTATKVADFNLTENFTRLTSSCTDISNPGACISGSKEILSKLGGLGIPALDRLTASVGATINQGIASLAQQFPILAGWLGQGGGGAPTSQEIDANNAQNLDRIATQSVGAEAGAKVAAANLLKSEGTYTYDLDKKIVQSKSEAMSAAILSPDALKTNQAKSDAAAADVKSSTELATEKDTSLDAVNASNQIGVKVVRGLERNFAEAKDTKTLIAQNLKQTKVLTETVDKANIQRDAVIQSHVTKQDALQCFQVSIYNPRVKCK
jgi:hypothetical protein